jgi:hypothetical protein
MSSARAVTAGPRPSAPPIAKASVASPCSRQAASRSARSRLDHGAPVASSATRRAPGGRAARISSASRAFSCAGGSFRFSSSSRIAGAGRRRPAYSACSSPSGPRRCLPMAMMAVRIAAA